MGRTSHQLVEFCLVFFSPLCSFFFFFLRISTQILGAWVHITGNHYPPMFYTLNKMFDLSAKSYEVLLKAMPKVDLLQWI